MIRIVFRDEPLSLEPWRDIDWTPWCEDFEAAVEWVVRTPALLTAALRRFRPVLDTGPRRSLTEEQQKYFNDRIRQADLNRK